MSSVLDLNFYWASPNKRAAHGAVTQLPLQQTLLRPPKGKPSAAQLLWNFQRLREKCKAPADLTAGFFRLLNDLADARCACFRRVWEQRLQFVEVKCDHAQNEKRGFSLEEKEDENIIVKAARDLLPIVDGDQTLNDNNPIWEDMPQDTGSIISFPYEGNCDTRWLYTSCNFQKKNAFKKYHAAALAFLFPLFDDAYQSLCYSQLEPVIPDVIRHTNAVFSDYRRLSQIGSIVNIEKLEHDSAYWLPPPSRDAAIDEGYVSTPQLLPTSSRLYGENATGQRPGQAAVMEALESSVGSNTGAIATVEGDNVRLSMQLGTKASEFTRPPDWPATLSVAILPIELVGLHKLGYVWAERYSEPTITLAELKELSQLSYAPARGLNLVPVRSPGGYRRTLYHTGSMQTVNERIRESVNDPTAPVLIYGPPGTGKLITAHTIHDNDHNLRRGHYTYIDESTTLETLQECLTSKGTVVVHRLEYIDRPKQLLLLRVLDEAGVRTSDGFRRLSARIIAVMSSTDRNGQTDLVPGLLDRLKYSGISIELPPLAKRLDELADIVEHVLKHGPLELLPQKDFEPKVIDLLRRHNWPGNIPELERVLSVACSNAQNEKVLRVDHLPAEFTGAAERLRKAFPDAAKLVRAKRWYSLAVEKHQSSVQIAREDPDIDSPQTITKSIRKYAEALDVPGKTEHQERVEMAIARHKAQSSSKGK